MVDFAEEPPELQKLIDIVLDYNMGEIERELAKKPFMISFGDDLGAQTALPISPAKWRKYLKPCFARMYGRCRDAGSYVYMHTDGHILPIIKDLIDCGVNVVNPQIRANGVEGLARECKGKICMNLDLDRQMFPFCSPSDIDTHVREVVEKLGSPEGGLWLSAECGPDVPLANIDAICAAVERYRGMYSG
jgi:uroporphyrinogen-III decarboxylase